MKTQTKCTLAICGLFIVEILPVPVSSLYSLYVVRKRPDWLPAVVDRLYADKIEKGSMHLSLLIPAGHDPMSTRKKCTMTLAAMFVVDLLVPVVIPTALFVVRRRPLWFKNLVIRLYADRIVLVPPKPKETAYLRIEDPKVLERVEKKFVEIERMNRDFAKSFSKRQSRVHH